MLIAYLPTVCLSLSMSLSLSATHLPLIKNAVFSQLATNILAILAYAYIDWLMKFCLVLMPKLSKSFVRGLSISFYFFSFCVTRFVACGHTHTHTGTLPHNQWFLSIYIHTYIYPWMFRACNCVYCAFEICNSTFAMSFCVWANRCVDWKWLK